MKRIVALSVVLWAASWAKADDHAHQMLPLAVGNTWEYEYVFLRAGSGPYRPEILADDFGPGGLIYIGITHTELIGGHTYYVFGNIVHEKGSPLPQWLNEVVPELEKPPLPFFFLAGKRVRFDGNWLVFNEHGLISGILVRGRRASRLYVPHRFVHNIRNDRNEQELGPSPPRSRRLLRPTLSLVVR